MVARGAATLAALAALLLCGCVMPSTPPVLATFSAGSCAQALAGGADLALHPFFDMPQDEALRAFAAAVGDPILEPPGLVVDDPPGGLRGGHRTQAGVVWFGGPTDGTMTNLPVLHYSALRAWPGSDEAAARNNLTALVHALSFQGLGIRPAVSPAGLQTWSGQGAALHQYVGGLIVNDHHGWGQSNPSSNQGIALDFGPFWCLGPQAMRVTSDQANATALDFARAIMDGHNLTEAGGYSIDGFTIPVFLEVADGHVAYHVFVKFSIPSGSTVACPPDRVVVAVDAATGSATLVQDGTVCPGLDVDPVEEWNVARA